VLAANVDAVAVVEPLVPEPQLGRVERLLALAWDSGAAPHLVLTKADLCTDGDAVAAELAVQVAPGVPVHVVAAPSGLGLDELATLCATGRTLALLGGSGAGKSTLLNALVGADVMATNALATFGKGRHTTVTRELHPSASGGSVIDTPGLRGVGLLDSGGLAEVFSEVEDLATRCRFNDCLHVSEPGCAVIAAVEAGELSEARVERWRKLQREAEWIASRTDARLRQERKQEWKVIHKAVRSGRIRP
jgi:ribosome biogenesis GTPase